MSTIRLTTAQALVKFLNAQYVEFDGNRNGLLKGSLPFSATGMCWVLGRHWKKTRAI